MFHQLYKHLEEINYNTRQQKAVLLHSEEWAGRISEQLEELNLSILSQKKYQPRRGLRTMVYFIGSISLALVIILAWYSYQLSRATRLALEKAAESGRVSGLT